MLARSPLMEAPLPRPRLVLLVAVIPVVAFAVVVGAQVRPEVELAALLALPVAWLAVARAVGVPLAAFGLRLEAAPSLAHWARLGLLGSMAAALLVFVTVRASPLADGVPAPGISAQTFLERWVPYVSVLIPIGEELLFRSVLMGALVHAVPPWVAILADGAAFAAIHWVYGEASPVNNLAGFFFAWAFLRSGTVLIPLVFHMAGNFLGGLLGVVLHQYPELGRALGG